MSYYDNKGEFGDSSPNYTPTFGKSNVNHVFRRYIGEELVMQCNTIPYYEQSHYMDYSDYGMSQYVTNEPSESNSYAEGIREITESFRTWMNRVEIRLQALANEINEVISEERQVFNDIFFRISQMNEALERIKELQKLVPVEETRPKMSTFASKEQQPTQQGTNKIFTYICNFIENSKKRRENECTLVNENTCESSKNICENSVRESIINKPVNPLTEGIDFIFPLNAFNPVINLKTLLHDMLFPMCVISCIKLFIKELIIVMSNFDYRYEIKRRIKGRLAQPFDSCD